MTHRRGHLVFWLLLASGVSADLVSKYWAFAFLQHRQGYRYEIWEGVFRLNRAFNTGGPFSIFAGHNFWLVGVTVVAVGVILYLYLGSARDGRRLTLVSLALIASGAIGNLYDRISIRKVRDFLDFYWFNYPVFNVADVLITVGALLLIVELVRRDHARVSSAAQP
jgi:signal peptidase II